jgi:hypothetical protein
MKVALKIPEKDEPQLRISLRIIRPDGTYEIEDMTGATVAWVSKANERVADNTGQTIPGTIINQATDPVAIIQLSNVITNTAGSFFFKVVVTLNSHPRTFLYGPLTVTST